MNDDAMPASAPRAGVPAGELPVASGVCAAEQPGVVDEAREADLVHGEDPDRTAEGVNAVDEARVADRMRETDEPRVADEAREVDLVHESHEPHGPYGGGSVLSAADNALLDVEEKWWTLGRTKAEAIATTGMSPTRYYLAVNRVLANPQALMERPELVRRLVRLRTRRAEERGGTLGR